MHEMSLAVGVLQLVEETARREQAARVRRIILEIGQLAAVDRDAMRFCFEAVVRGSLAEGAVLDIQEIPGRAWCSTCAATVSMDERIAACPTCGNFQLQPTGGTEMHVREIEIE